MLTGQLLIIVAILDSILVVFLLLCILYIYFIYIFHLAEELANGELDLDGIDDEELEQVNKSVKTIPVPMC